jgi:hypothetical protein
MYFVDPHTHVSDFSLVNLITEIQTGYNQEGYCLLGCDTIQYGIRCPTCFRTEKCRYNFPTKTFSNMKLITRVPSFMLNTKEGCPNTHASKQRWETRLRNPCVDCHTRLACPSQHAREPPKKPRFMPTASRLSTSWKNLNSAWRIVGGSEHFLMNILEFSISCGSWMKHGSTARLLPMGHSQRSCIRK